MAQTASPARPAFGSGANRFGMSNVHPQNRTPGTYLQVAHQSLDDASTHRGPGSYNLERGGFAVDAVVKRAKGPGWKEKVETEEATAHPDKLHTKMHRQAEARLDAIMGPGKYEVQTFMDILDKKPQSKVHVCARTAPRIDPGDKFNGGLAGPGAYGIPHQAKEASDRMPFGTKGLLSQGSPKDRALGGGMGNPILGPATYKLVRFPESDLAKKTSERGPYDLFTGSRGKPIRTGHMASPQRNQLGPGQYPCKSFLDDWTEDCSEKKGRVSLVPGATVQKTSRLACTTLEQIIRPKDHPGPTTYFKRPRTKSAPTHLSLPAGPLLPPATASANALTMTMGQKTKIAAGRRRVPTAPPAAFGTRASRTHDVVAKKCFHASEFRNSVARDDVLKWHRGQHINAHQ